MAWIETSQQGPNNNMEEEAVRQSFLFKMIVDDYERTISRLVAEKEIAASRNEQMLEVLKLDIEAKENLSNIIQQADTRILSKIQDLETDMSCMKSENTLVNEKFKDIQEEIDTAELELASFKEMVRMQMNNKEERMQRAQEDSEEVMKRLRKELHKKKKTFKMLQLMLIKKSENLEKILKLKAAWEDAANL